MKVFIKYYLLSIYETTSWTLRAFKNFYFYRVAYMHRIYLAFSLIIVSAVFNNFETSELSVPINPRSVYRNFENFLTPSFPPKSIKIESKLLKTPYIPFFYCSWSYSHIKVLFKPVLFLWLSQKWHVGQSSLFFLFLFCFLGFFACPKMPFCSVLSLNWCRFHKIYTSYTKSKCISVEIIFHGFCFRIFTSCQSKIISV